MNTERDYLYLAVEKAGCVVMVRHFDSAEKIRRSKIEYISDNVERIGMNIQTVKKGYRLPEDYIHPDDREGFADAMARAFRLGNDFSYELRVIGDDGVLRRINMDVIFLKTEDKDFLVEYIFRELARYKQETVSGQIDEEDLSSIKFTKEFIDQNMLEDYFNNYASSCDLYSTVLDLNGRIIVEPSGPKSYLGEFYNYMENLEYDPFFSKIKNSVVQDIGPLFMELEEIGTESTYSEGRLSAAPIVINGICCGIWIMYAHNAAQAQKLFKVYRNQWSIAEVMSSHLSKLYSKSISVAEDISERDALEFEIQEKKIVNSIMSEMDEGELDLEKCFAKVGTLLGVDHVVYYMNDPSNPEKMNLGEFWSREGKASMGKQPFEWNHDHYDKDIQIKIKDEGIVIDSKSMTNKMRVEVFEGNVRAIMVFPLKRKKKYYGRLIFIENSRERLWKESEVNFAREITKLVAKSVAAREENIGFTEDLEMMYTVLDAVDSIAFIRNDDTGRIVYCNDAFKKLFNTDMIGADSFRMIPKGVEDLSVLSDNPKTSAEKKNSTRFTRYINELGGIFDVSEIFLDSKNGEKMAAIILIPAAG